MELSKSEILDLGVIGKIVENLYDDDIEVEGVEIKHAKGVTPYFFFCKH